MKVIHIIPAAFNYFDDIRAAAFELAENLPKFGVEAEAFTLQYGMQQAGKKTQEAVGESAPSRKFMGMAKIDEVVASFKDFDAVHLHAPFLGAAGRLLAWREANHGIPFVITYYRRVPLSDFFSLFISWYNGYYLPRLFRAADAVACSSEEAFKKSGRGMLSDKSKLVIVDGTEYFLNEPLTKDGDGVQLSQEDIVAMKYAVVYQQLLAKIHNP